MAGDMADDIEMFVADYDLLGGDGAECATEYWSPCCFGGVYAHFYGGKHVGFQCCECGKDYDTDHEFDT